MNKVNKELRQAIEQELVILIEETKRELAQMGFSPRQYGRWKNLCSDYAEWAIDETLVDVPGWESVDLDELENLPVYQKCLQYKSALNSLLR